MFLDVQNLLTSQHRMQCNPSYVTEKNILFFWAKRVLDSKMSVTGDGFPSIGETRSRSMQWLIMIIIRWSHPSKLSKKCQTALKMSLHCDLQLTTGTRNFSSAE